LREITKNDCIIYKAYSKRKANTRPINPLTSTKLNPIKLHLIKVFDKTGFLLIEINKKLKISPTPIPTPAKDTRGILDAKYLNPSNIMDSIIRSKQYKILGE